MKNAPHLDTSKLSSHNFEKYFLKKKQLVGLNKLKYIVT